MIPLTVTATLLTPVAGDSPLLLDGILYAGLGRRTGDAAPGGWVDPRGVYERPLPLARVEVAESVWWWAASQAIPQGPEELAYSHRRPPVREATRWTSARSLNRATGPDKALRVAVYYRPHWRRITWTAVGDLREVQALLAWIPAVGRRTSQGWGWVSHWRVSAGGRPLSHYRTHLDTRPFPADYVAAQGEAIVMPPRARLREMPLTPPYYGRRRSVRVWQAR